MSTIKFTGILPALVTPLGKDNKTVNTDAVKKLIDLQLSQGAEGFYILGGTGEGIVLPREARELMCQTVIEHVKGRKPIIDHIAATEMSQAIELAKHAQKAGTDAIAAIPPLFFCYSEDDIYEYYKALSLSVDIPVIIYYHPAAQKDMSAKLIARIFEIDNVTGVKWSSTDLFEMMKLKDMTHGDMNIICGPDELLISGLAAGADAGIGSTYNVMLPEFVEIYRLFKEGDLEKALEIQLKVNNVIDLLEAYGLIPAVKLAIKLMGIDVGDATFPMKRFSHDETVRFQNDIKSLGWPFH